MTPFEQSVPDREAGDAAAAPPAELPGTVENAIPAEHTEPDGGENLAEASEPDEAANPAELPWDTEWDRHFPGWQSEQEEAAAGEASETASQEILETALETASASPEAADSSESGTRARPDSPPPLSRTSPAGRSGNHRPARRRRRRRRRHQGVWIFLAGLSTALLLTAGTHLWALYRSRTDPFLWDYAEREERNQKTEISIPVWPVGQGETFRITPRHGERLTAQEVYRTVNPTVVTVMVGLNDAEAVVGTGVVISGDGYFLTNYHVVEGGRECMALLDDGRRFKAMYVAGDADSDLAVLKMKVSDSEDGGSLTAAEFGDSDLLTVGDDVYAIGNPLGVELRGTMTNGIVSAENREVLVDGRLMTLIQTNAALNSGNSGGPLINEYGQVVGINVVKMSSRRSTVEGLGFAIPSASMERLVNDLITFGASQPVPVMGIQVERAVEEVEEGLRGLRIVGVDDGSSAAAAGVRENDCILSADGEEMHSSQTLLRMRNRHYVGEQMALSLWRDGERLEVVLDLTEPAQTA